MNLTIGILLRLTPFFALLALSVFLTWFFRDLDPKDAAYGVGGFYMVTLFSLLPTGYAIGDFLRERREWLLDGRFVWYDTIGTAWLQNNKMAQRHDGRRYQIYYDNGKTLADYNTGEETAYNERKEMGV